MSENAAPPGATDLLTPYLRRNYTFLVVLLLLITMPGVITYFGPPVFPFLAGFYWLGIAYGFALVLGFLADEVFVPGERNLSTGFGHAGHISHNLITNPLFLLGLLLILFAPPPVTYFGPLVAANSPDWLWLVLGWVVALVAAAMMYFAIKGEEAKIS